MKNYLCWKPGTVRQIINPFAEHMADGLFRAVHTDWDLMVSPPVGKSFQEVTDLSFDGLSPTAFLEDFLRSDRPHVLAAILGETGSGKSHLVHWMRLHLKSSESRLVLVVRKSGTSLRAIVRMIIDELPIEEQQGFLDTLNASGEGTATRAGQKQQLLNDLAQSIRDETLPPNADEVEVELAQRLPDLFQDPHMRDAHFLGEDSVVAEIVDHIFAPSNAQDRPERRRSFTAADLPVGGSDFVHASKHARDAIKIIDLNPVAHLALAVDIVNRNLDRAVARTLSFTGDRVEELMTRLRAHLKSKGMELVLLVEEFARLQGIDRALLQTMTSHGDERLCRMRSAIAVTTGFFESVAETAYMRTTHIVDMDRSAGRAGGARVTPASLSAFSARYLNAVRLGAARIEAWSAQASASDIIPSACERCDFRRVCHDTFGEVDGYGLYPFTPTALMIGATRVDATMPEALNPRILQNDLLVEVLDNQAQSIQVGDFPSLQLLNKLGGDTDRRLGLQAQAQLRNANPANADRWIAVLELYDGTGRVVDLPSDLRGALSIPEIPGAEALSATPIAPQPDDGDAAAQSAGPRATREDLMIETWINGSGLDQNVATTLRPLIFAAVSEAIDWDMLGLSKSVYLGKGRALQTNSVSFDRQTTQIAEFAQVKLRIPADHVDPATTGLALQGLIRAAKNDFNWDFPDGDKMLPAFLECITAWAADLEHQLTRIAVPSASWTPAAAALELLSVASAIGGRLKPDASIADMIDAAFSTPANECASTAPSMIAIYEKLRRNRDKLATLARSRISSQKGGQVGAMLDPSRYLATIRGLRQAKWRLNLQPPSDDAGDIAKLYRDVQAQLPDAAQAEWTIRTAWLSSVSEAFGETATRSEIASSLRAARQAALDVGLNTQGASRPLSDALEAFEGVRFDETVTAVRAMAKLEDPVAALANFGRGRRNATETASRLIQTARQFLDTVDQNVGDFGAEHRAKHDAITASLTNIDDALETIGATLETLAAREVRSDVA